MENERSIKRQKLTTAVFVTISMLAITAVPASSNNIAKRISIDTAAKIVHLALGQGDDLGVEPLIPAEEDGFYRIELWLPVGEGSAGLLGVNVWTGDVWDMKFCEGRSKKRITSPAAREVQREIRKHLGLSDEAYRRLAGRSPRCMFP